MYVTFLPFNNENKHVIFAYYFCSIVLKEKCYGHIACISLGRQKLQLAFNLILFFLRNGQSPALIWNQTKR